ncbi:MAG: chemotaxis protein CheB [Thermodesulfobacteriota bacterium]
MADQIPTDNTRSPFERKETSPPKAPEHGTAHHIVGIGASAGGLEALERLFRNMPPDSGMGFVVVQHLSPDYKSLMVELLSKHTRMSVFRAEDGHPVHPDCVYLIPPKKNMTIERSKLRLREKDSQSGINLPIDIFFRSLAKDRGETAIGIILSGTGSDGMRGVRAIKESGGMVMVQDEESARFNGMPRSAISTGVADYILPPEEMPAELVHFTKHHVPNQGDTSQKSLITDEDTLGNILQLLNQESGVDFSYYKPSTVIRRIERRLQVNQLEKLDEYLRYMRKSPREKFLLYKEILIGVTNFFRDPEAYEKVAKEVIPAIFEDRSSKDPVRVWCAGCSTGEEAYSLAMLFMEYFEAAGKTADIKIFATDIDREALTFAGNGTYPESIAADLSPERLQRFFTKKEGNYQVSRRIREMVVFAAHNLSKDPPFTRTDLISCRNLLIYLKPVLQKKILSLFSFSLKTSGFLFLGSSESLGDQSDHFNTLDTKWKLFQARSDHKAPLAPTLSMPELTPKKRVSKTSLGHSQRITFELLEQICHTMVLSTSRCCILVDEDFKLVYIFGDSGDYLTFAGGEVSLDVLKLVHPEISMPMGTALHRTLKEEKEIVYKDISFKKKDRLRQIDLRVRIIQSDRQTRRYLLVFFEPSTQIVPHTGDEKNGDRPNVQAGYRIQDLEQDLQQTRENLQATIEELETSNEELQATNEELLASNEELQSTNEELQSVNEELYTVNNEYQHKIQELTDLNNDMDNLLRCTDIGTVFLDNAMRIRRFTPASTRHINLMEQDVDRPLSHISHNLHYDEFGDDARQVIQTGKGFTREVSHKNGAPILIKMFPYLDENDHPRGAVVNFVDVSVLQKAEDDLAHMQKEKDHLLNHFIEMFPGRMAIISPQGEVKATNRAWREYAEQEDSELKSASENGDYTTLWRRFSEDEGECSVETLKERLKSVLEGNTPFFSGAYTWSGEDGAKRVLIQATRLQEKGGGMVISHADIPEAAVCD